MPITWTFRESIWPSIDVALCHLQIERKDGLSPAVRAGINFSIIVGSACYVEGVLETELKAILAHRRVNYRRLRGRMREQRPMNFFYHRLEEDLENRIRSANVAAYDDMFELLMGQRLSKLPGVKPIWEGLSVLFQLRNVLGHGREVIAQHVIAYEGSKKEEVFFGGYRKAEDYLRKNKLLKRKFTDAHSEYIFLSDAIADHFWSIARRVPKAVSKSLDDRERRAVEKALRQWAIP